MERLMKGRTIFIIAHRSVTLILYNSFHKYVTNILMNIFYVPEPYIMHFIWRCWFLNCSVQRPVWMGGGGRSRAIKFLYAPAPLLPTVRALWVEVFFGPKWYSPIGLMPFRMTQKTKKKLSISRAQPPLTCPSNGCCPHQKHYARVNKNHGCINSY